MTTPLGGTTPNEQTQMAAQTSAAAAAEKMAPPVRSGGSIKKGVSTMEELKKVAPQFMDAMMKSMASSICSKMKDSQERQKKISRGGV